jgi:coenzyme F420 hydrogenase subunit beta
MIGRRVRDIRDVAELQLCSGCGACAYLSPDEIRMVDAVELGRRPLVQGPLCDPRSHEAMQVCPGVEVAHRGRPHTGAIESLRDAWGPVLEVWEGYATDAKLRFEGSSGAAGSALALYCIERGGMHGLLHVTPRPDAPYLCQTVLSSTRAEILAATGSRYAPASPCDGLAQVERAPAPCVMLGKPCDVAAAKRASELRPALAQKLGLTIAIFCAGTPSLRGTLELLRSLGVSDPREVAELRYRGRGWPGRFTVRTRGANGAEKIHQMTYAESWDFLQRYRQWRCYVCADHTGELADVAVGDPWYRPIPPDEPGRSLVLVRTERGRRIVEAALREGYLTLERADPSIVALSQPELLRTRGAVWGRIAALRLLGAPSPRFRGMPMRRFFWSELGWRERAQALAGTARRVFRKRLLHRQRYRPFEPEPPER